MTTVLQGEMLPKENEVTYLELDGILYKKVEGTIFDAVLQAEEILREKMVCETKNYYLEWEDEYRLVLKSVEKFSPVQYDRVENVIQII
jgi:hypothetical protein